MDQLKCENCGSTDFIKRGNTYVCQYCGSVYPVLEDISRKVPYENQTQAVNDQTVKENMATPQKVNINVNVNQNQKAGPVFYGVKSRKGWMTTLLLCIFCGYFGIHRFYAGKTGTGILWLCTMGCFGIGWIVDIFVIASGKFKDGKGLYISRR